MSKASPILIVSFGLAIANGLVAQDVKKKKIEAAISEKVEQVQTETPKLESPTVPQEAAPEQVEEINETVSDIKEKVQKQVSGAKENGANAELTKVPEVETTTEAEKTAQSPASDEFKLEENDDVQVPASPLPEKETADTRDSEQSVLPRVNAEGNNTITGTIFDAESGRGLPGVNISLPELDLFARTDTQGNFTLEKVPAGRIKISAIKIGYFALDSTVKVTEGKKATFSKGLAAKPVETDNETHVLDDYDVVAEYVEEEEFSIDLGQTDSGSLVSGITEAEFSRQAISDAGDAVEKVSGANIVDGKFAVVRGLADRYISTTFNGAAISSADPSRKAVQLDLFPSSTIKAINVLKTHNPRISGDFGGAAIDIVSKTFPEERILNFKIKYEYDPSLPDNFFVHPTQDLGFFGDLGRVPNTNNILERNAADSLRLVSVDTRNPTQEQADRVLAAYSEFVENRPLLPKEDDPEQELSFGVNYGDTFDLAENFKLGVLISGGRKNEDSYNESEQFRIPGRRWFQQDYSRSREWNAYLALGAKAGDFNEVSFSYFRKHITEHNVRLGTGVRDPENSVFGRIDRDTISGPANIFGAAAEISRNFVEIEPVERDLEIIQFKGTHGIDERSPSAYWSFTSSSAQESRPDSTFFETTVLDFANPNLIEALSEERNAQANAISTALTRRGAIDEPFANLEEAFQFIQNNEPIIQQLFRRSSQELIDLINDRLTPIDPSRGQLETVALSAISGEAGPGNTTTYGISSIDEKTSDQGFGFKIPIFFSEENEDRGLEFDLGYNVVERERKTRGFLFEAIYESAAGDGIDSGFLEQELYGRPDGQLVPVIDRNGNILAVTQGIGEYLASNSVFPYYFRSISPDARDPFILDGSTGTGNFAGRVANNIDATHDIKSYYASTRFFWDDFQIIGGIRYEKEKRTAEFVEPTPLVNGEIPEVDDFEESTWLPSFSISNRYLDDRLGIVGAWSRTTARPTFFEWVPTSTFDLSTGFFRGGRADLDNSRITNLELAIDYQPTDYSEIRASFFKKDIADPIIEVQRPVGNTPGLTYINADSGSIAGIELEGQIRDIMGFSLTGNITYIDASLDYEVDGRGVVTENFPFQPTWIANLNLGYEHEEWGFGANLVYNFTGEYATLLRTVPTDPNVVQNSQHAIDLILRKSFGEEDQYTVTFGIKNLYATDREFSFEGGAGGFDGSLRSRNSNDRLYFIDFKAEF